MSAISGHGRFGFAAKAKEAQLPERVRQAIRSQEDATERLIGWIQLAVILTFATLYAISPKTAPMEQPFHPVPWVIGAYFLFTLIRLALAYRTSLPGWFLLLSIVIDMALLFGLIWSFHLTYQQPASFYLKAPTLLYVFIFIALRALRFEARFVFAAGVIAALGWLGLVLYVILIDPQDSMITRNYVSYLTSNSVLLGAEFDKMISILVVSAILGVAIVRGRALLVRSVAESAAARELSRFFAPEIAQKIRASAQQIAAGSGELRDAAILNVDMRGFTRLAQRTPAGEVMELLAEYQSRVVPVIQANGGSIDKFLGDGIMATFGAAQVSPSYAADALRAMESLIAEAERWRAERSAAGKETPAVNAAVSTGRILFGAVGDETRLEFTVIGDAVNLSAKLEKHNRDLGTRALATAEAHALACAQGYRPPAEPERHAAVQVGGIEAPLDLVAIAR
ncbi:MAG: adenylate/guanylate cyclase domain-containing protein [Kiloniellales bacterium]